MDQEVNKKHKTLAKLQQPLSRLPPGPSANGAWMLESISQACPLPERGILFGLHHNFNVFVFPSQFSSFWTSFQFHLYTYTSLPLVCSFFELLFLSGCLFFLVCLQLLVSLFFYLDFFIFIYLSPFFYLLLMFCVVVFLFLSYKLFQNIFVVYFVIPFCAYDFRLLPFQSLLQSYHLFCTICNLLLFLFISTLFYVFFYLFCLFVLFLPIFRTKAKPLNIYRNLPVKFPGSSSSPWTSETKQ